MCFILRCKRLCVCVCVCDNDDARSHDCNWLMQAEHTAEQHQFRATHSFCHMFISVFFILLFFTFKFVAYTLVFLSFILPFLVRRKFAYLSIFDYHKNEAENEMRTWSVLLLFIYLFLFFFSFFYYFTNIRTP